MVFIEEALIMTVKQLREALSKLDENTNIVVYCQDGNEHQFFEINTVSLRKGAPKRLAGERAGFEFAHDGPAEWAFISVEPA
jgi:hypothetical protein